MGLVLLLIVLQKTRLLAVSKMEFALRLYTILDLMYTFVRSAQILNTVHQSYQMVIYSSNKAGIANHNL